MPEQPQAGFKRHLDGDEFRLMVESTTDYAIFLLDPQARVASWNAGAERIKGYQANEIIGRHFSAFYTQEAIDRGWPEHELAEARRVGRFEDEGWRVRKDGSRFWAHVIITALRGADGTLRGFAKVTRDLTLHKRHEERIAKLTSELQARVAELDATNRELAQRSAENERFVYSVSHDLRSPLVNLQGFSHELVLASAALRHLLTRSDVPDDVKQHARLILDGDLQESVGFIRNAVTHLGNIIDGLLRLSRIGRIEYEHTAVDVTDLLGGILASLHTTIIESQAAVEVHPLPQVNGDRNAIGQVFANLVDNALKSFEGGGRRCIQISASNTVPPVFAVRDNGIGIPAEHQARSFQAFQRVQPGHHHGEGMGLAIVRRIIERHGGRIWLDSTLGVGTTVFFTLAPDNRRTSQPGEEAGMTRRLPPEHPPQVAHDG